MECRIENWTMTLFERKKHRLVVVASEVIPSALASIVATTTTTTRYVPSNSLCFCSRRWWNVIVMIVFLSDFMGELDGSIVAVSATTTISKEKRIRTTTSTDYRNTSISTFRPKNDDILTLLHMDQFYSYDGRGNNYENPQWGAVGEGRIRSYPPMNGYVDGVGEPLTNSSIVATPSQIMAELFSRMTPPKVISARNQHRFSLQLSQLLPYFGEFITRDITVTDVNVSDPLPFECYTKSPSSSTSTGTPAILSPATSLYYCSRDSTQNNNNNTDSDDHLFVKFFRSPFKDGYDTDHPRAPISTRSAFLDLSNIYGHDQEKARSLRAMSAGKMALSKRDGLPLRDHNTGTFIVGDDMTRSNPGLLSLTVVFLRYHNLLADQYANLYPQLDDEQLFQLARMENIAVYQNIVEEKYIPSLLLDTLDSYQGYDPTVDPSIDVFFSTVAFRYGHSAISGIIRMMGSKYEPLEQYDPLLLRDVFWNMEPWIDNVRQFLEVTSQNDDATTSNHTTKNTSPYPISGLEPFLRGLTVEPEKDVDLSFVPDMTVFTKMVPSINIQRGRDHGMPTYNHVRQFFHLTTFDTFQDLLSDIGMETDPELADILSSLYNHDIDLIDSYVGALLETEFGFTNNPNGAFVGPTMAASLKEQFTRLRNGDRLWFKNRYHPQEIDQFPSLSQIIKLVFPEDQMAFFPDDSFIVYDPQYDDETCSEQSSSVSLLDGTYVASWSYDNENNWIDLKLTVYEKIQGGFIGIGWHRQIMSGTTIWFCKTVEEKDFQYPLTCSYNSTVGDTDTDAQNEPSQPLFSCCVAPGKNHETPKCTKEHDQIYMKLDVIQQCLSEEESSVTIRAPVCNNNNNTSSNSATNCLDIEEPLDFIVAYNPTSQSKTHGVARRQFGTIDLSVSGTKVEVQETQQKDLFAMHGIYMLVCWMLIAPTAIFVARYMRHHTWWLPVHVTLMTIVESTTFPLIAAALTSVGTNNPATDHRVTGIVLVCFFPFITGLGVIRRYCLDSEKLFWGLDRSLSLLHKISGWIILILALWNCYTGLIRIGPDDSYIAMLTVGSEPKGYNFEGFGTIRKYVYFPLLVFVALNFVTAEIYQRSISRKFHRDKEEKGIWGDFAEEHPDLEIMSVQTFKESTLHGRQLCVVDGYVIDIADFINRHPGGRSMLRFARGTDITKELLGERQVDGRLHPHSAFAYRQLKTLVVARIEIPTANTDDEKRPGSASSLVSGLAGFFSGGWTKKKSSGAFSSQDNLSLNDSSAHRYNSPEPLRTKQKDYLYVEEGIHQTVVYETAQIESFKNVTPLVPVDDKPVIQVFVLVPQTSSVARESPDASASAVSFTSSPGAHCILRVEGSKHEMIDRPQTPVTFQRLSNGDIRYEFYISMVPGGKMSTALQKMQRGQMLHVMRPNVDYSLMEKINAKLWRLNMIFATGTGIAPCIQLIDYLLGKFSKAVGTFQGRRLGGSRIFLVWILKDSEHNYMEECGLHDRIQKSKGLIKWIVIYHSSSFKKKDVPTRKRRSFRQGTYWQTVKNVSFFGPKRHTIKDACRGGNCDSLAIDQDHTTSSDNNNTRRFPSVRDLQPLEVDNRNNDSEMSFDIDMLNESETTKETVNWWKGGYITYRLDKELMRSLFASARQLVDADRQSSREESKNDSGSTFNNKHDTTTNNNDHDDKKKSMYDDVLVALSGRSKFETACLDDLKRIGLTDEQIINFG